MPGIEFQSVHDDNVEIFMNAIICTECQREGKTSHVYPRGGYVTLLYCQPFYDENGRYHNHDSNMTTSAYECSNGHSWQTKRGGSCWCGWSS